MTEASSFDTTNGTNIQPQSPSAEAGVDNVIVVDNPDHTNGSILNGGADSSNTVAFGTNVNYDLTDLNDFQNIEKVNFGSGAADDAVDFEKTLTVSQKQDNKIDRYISAVDASIEVVKDVTDDYSSSTDTSGSVEVGGSTSGEIEVTEDKDWFAVDLTRDTAYSFKLSGSGTGGGTLSEGDVNLYDKDTTDSMKIGLAGANMSYEEAGQFSLIAEESGTYYLGVSSWEDTGTYTLNVEESSPEDEVRADATGNEMVDDSIAQASTMNFESEVHLMGVDDSQNLQSIAMEAT